MIGFTNVDGVYQMLLQENVYIVGQTSVFKADSITICWDMYSLGFS